MWGELMNPEGRSGKPPSCGKKIPRVYRQSQQPRNLGGNFLGIIDRRPRDQCH